MFLPSRIRNSRSLQEGGLKDLSVLTTISNVVLPSGARSTSNLGDRAEIDSIGRDDAGDGTASAEEADAGTAREITDDAVVGDHVELATSKRHLGSAHRSALRDGDGFNTHFVVVVKVNKECDVSKVLRRRDDVSKGDDEGVRMCKGEDHLPTKAWGARDEKKEWLPWSCVAVVVGKGRKTGGGVGDEREGRRKCWPEESGSRGVNRSSKNEGEVEKSGTGSKQKAQVPFTIGNRGNIQ